MFSLAGNTIAGNWPKDSSSMKEMLITGRPVQLHSSPLSECYSIAADTRAMNKRRRKKISSGRDNKKNGKWNRSRNLDFRFWWTFPFTKLGLMTMWLQTGQFCTPEFASRFSFFSQDQFSLVKFYTLLAQWCGIHSHQSKRRETPAKIWTWRWNKK